MQKQKKNKAVWQKKGHEGIYECSNCKEEAYWDTDFGQQLFKYCPYCGSCMDNLKTNDGSDAFHHWYL